jgi:hypothetical protein
VPVTRGWTPDEPSRESRALLSCFDKAHAITLVLEFLRDGEDFPAALLALILVGWGANSRRDGHPSGEEPNPYRDNHGVGRRVDHRDGVGYEIGHVGSGSVRRDRYPRGVATGIVATTVLVAVSMTETVLDSLVT